MEKSKTGNIEHLQKRKASCQMKIKTNAGWRDYSPKSTDKQRDQGNLNGKIGNRLKQKQLFKQLII